MEKQKTAVEWLVEQLFGDNEIIGCSDELLQQAKEMDKERIIQAYEHGQNNGYMYRDGNSNIIQAEQYYNETFKSE